MLAKMKDLFNKAFANKSTLKEIFPVIKNDMYNSILRLGGPCDKSITQTYKGDVNLPSLKCYPPIKNLIQDIVHTKFEDHRKLIVSIL
jgi:hypothetical protein